MKHSEVSSGSGSQISGSQGFDHVSGAVSVLVSVAPVSVTVGSGPVTVAQGDSQFAAIVASSSQCAGELLQSNVGVVAGSLALSEAPFSSLVAGSGPEAVAGEARLSGSLG